MGEMVDRVAEALYRNACEQMPGTQPAAPWAELCEKLPNYVEGWRGAARAALSATREPSETMIRAGDNAMPFAGPTDQMWRAMIDEALK